MAKIVRTTAQNGSYHTNVYLGKDANGKNIYKHITGLSKIEVEEEVHKLKTEFRRHKEIQKKPDCMTVKEAMERYISEMRGILSTNSLMRYVVVSKHYFKSLHDVPLESLTSALVNAAIREDQKRFTQKGTPVKASTLQGAWRCVHRVIYYYADDMPRLRVALPRVEEPDRYAFSDEDMDNTISSIKNPMVRKAAAFAIYTGMRRSEICGLHWEDIDFDKRIAYVRRAIVRGDVRHEWIEKEIPKTKKSRRMVDLPEIALTVLRSITCTQARIFPISPDKLTDAFSYVVKKNLNVKGFTFHSTRAYAVTVDKELGIDGDFTEARVGHTNREQTAEYVRIRSAKQREYSEMRHAAYTKMLPNISLDD